MNEMDYDLKELRWNVINEVDNVTREELMLSVYAMMCCKQITDGGSGIVTYLSENVIETSNNSGPVLSNLLEK